MDTRPDELLLRQYLLGLLPEPEWDEIEQKLLTNDAFAKTVEVVEDEIVDDYLDGTLSGSHRRAAENHFFQAPEHRRKLQFARLLRFHLRREKPVERLRSLPLPVPRAFYWAASIAIVSLLALTAGLGIYAAKLRHDLRTEMAEHRDAQSTLQAYLAQEHSLTAQLQKQLRLIQGSENVAQSSSIILNLVPLERALGSIPQVKRVPEPEWLEVHIPLIDFVSASYKASLRDANGKELWSSGNLKPKSSGVLVFKIPYQVVSAGDYSVVISGERASHTYPFRVS